ncbi:phage holin family protein [Streptomyces sp. DSM 44917]|uniref:Phage holin family protein n=1 Tax=Streptomyces boetiae TaxID=3075541 RepID=A0ABU2L6E0_9ACTN|nr:phage holin family protein [Streptomyces sp. DSM 44917]MDT0307080.1 phage holin family protein [Streptomyces sp. DSM 44917]
MSSLFFRFVANAVALAVAVWVVDGITLGDGDADTGARAATLCVVALIFGAVNVVVKPIVSFFSLPLLILTLGLFTLVINAAMLGLTAALSGDAFNVDGFGAAFWGGLIISIVSWAVNLVLDRD